MDGVTTWTNKQRMRGLVGLEWPAETWSELVMRIEATVRTGYILIYYCQINNHFRWSCYDWGYQDTGQD